MKIETENASECAQDKSTNGLVITEDAFASKGFSEVCREAQLRKDHCSKRSGHVGQPRGEEQIENLR